MTKAGSSVAARRSRKLTAAVMAHDDSAGAIVAALEDEQFAVARFDALGLICDAHNELSVAVLSLRPESISEMLGPLANIDGELPVVLACERIGRRELRAALAADVAGVVLHETVAQTLGPCVRAALAGQVCVPPTHWRQMEPPVLSTREKQILGLVVMGYMNSEIAQRLYVAESTVKSHLSSAFGKLGVRSRNEAVSLILDPDRGLGMGILALGGEPVQTPSAARSTAPAPG